MSSAALPVVQIFIFAHLELLGSTINVTSLILLL